MLRPSECLLSSKFLLCNVVHRAEIVKWVCESLRPFVIVKDRGFQCLMKTGRPEYYIPSNLTVSRDVRLVFARTRVRVAKMLKVLFSPLISGRAAQGTHQEYDGKLSFTTDTWTTPNHRALVAFSVHLQHKGMPLSFPLDVVEVVKVMYLRA